jgi:amino acid transporter
MVVRKWLKNTFIGQAKNPQDQKVFHNLSLIAFFAWVGLGADGLSSACYGPEEAYLALGSHPYLSLFVAIASALTVLLISASYSQIIEVFPSGGGGYLVASKLLSPGIGMVSGCALLIDYILTIAISVASGVDALFSFLPPHWLVYKLFTAAVVVLFLTLVNMRGVKESVIPLIPVFLTFLATHAFIIIYGIAVHVPDLPALHQSVTADIQAAHAEIGFWGLVFVLMRAYSMGAGTYTGIEAVSNGLSILREPRVETGKKTMRYMSLSLAFTVMGLMIVYLLFSVHHEPGKTLNASLFEIVTSNWAEPWGHSFVWITLLSEALILFVAAQAGFLGGPGVLANMAIDRWFPSKFAMLSDRLVTQNGIILMGGAALVTVLLTHASVKLLVVLYSINVFITFCFSQLGMVLHWWNHRSQVRKWKKKILINGTGFTLTTIILISVVILKFHEGGWVTLVITGSLVAVAIYIKRHYLHTLKLLHRLNSLVQAVSIPTDQPPEAWDKKVDYDAKTAVVLVNGFNGLGLHTLFNVIKYFGKEFKNFIFIQVGVIDAGNFKGVNEVERLKEKVREDVDRYVQYMRQNGCYSEGSICVGIDAIDEVEKTSIELLKRFPQAIFFGGQLVFPRESFWTRLLHNNTVFAMQRRFYQQGIPFVILPIRV